MIIVKSVSEPLNLENRFNENVIRTYITGEISSSYVGKCIGLHALSTF